MTFGIEFWAIVGFVFAAYAVVGNDALQTLGTFINSNRNLHWTVLFAFAALILVVTFTYGWVANGGDPSYGRLANEAKYPPITIEWYHTLPPLVLVVITRLGIPVSTSFMVLTIFATLGGLGSMLEKSLIGYAVAFATGGILYAALSQTLEGWFRRHPVDSPGATAPHGVMLIFGGGFFALQYFVFGTLESAGTFWGAIAVLAGLEAFALFAIRRNGNQAYWVILQWVATAYLWSVWLIQDFANIFVFLPRELTAVEGFGALGIIIILLGLTFANGGGPVQRILRTKSSVTDIRSATIIDFVYATLLFFFKEVSDIPMSTTWVFLGLIAGREYAFALTTKAIRMGLTVIDTTEDIAKAFLGIVVSIDLAVGLPAIAQAVAGEPVAFGDIFVSRSFTVFLAIANLVAVPTIWFAFSRPEDHPSEAKRNIALIFIALFLSMAGLFFGFPING